MGINNIEISSIKLSEFFKLFKPTHILGTTYTISLMFFGSVIWPIINKSKLERCLLICDKTGFKRSAFEVIGLREAGINYMVVPATHSFRQSLT